MRCLLPLQFLPYSQPAPLLEGIFEKIEEVRRQTIPSEPLRKAIDYTLNQQKALCRHLEDGRLRPDNNLAENAIRPVVLGRKKLALRGKRTGRMDRCSVHGTDQILQGL
jgi:transposase